MTKQILPVPKMSRPKRAQRLALLQLHEKSKPIFASNLRFSTIFSPTLPTLPPLISPIYLEPQLIPLTLQQTGTVINYSGTIRNRSPKPSPLSRPRFQEKQDRVKRALAPAGDVGPHPKSSSLTKWRCYLCGRRYAIGVTRRCLRDGHFLCFPVPVNNSQLGFKKTQDHPSVGVAKIAVEEGRNEKAKAVIALRQKIKARYRLLMKSNQMSRACAVEFDYAGWSAYGVWKRGGKLGLGMPCEDGCDWPGECRERERRAAKEMRKSKRLGRVAEMVTYSHRFCSVARVINS